MPINSFLYPGAKVVTGYNVDNSTRFNRSDDPSLTRTFGATSTNRLKFSVSFWMKRSNITISGGSAIFGCVGGDTSNFGTIHFNPTDQLCIADASGGPDDINLITNRRFRDVSAWYHIVYAIDSTQSTASDRVKLYVNGVQETSFATETYPAQNNNFHFNRGGKVHQISKFPYGASHLAFDGYITEFFWIDGVAHSPNDFGEFEEDSGIWIPKDCVDDLTFGNQGFYLDFEDSSALGNDVSGNDNDFTVNNLTSIDQTTDTCTNNYCTLNPLQAEIGATTLSEGNTKLVTTGGSGTSGNTVCTFGVSSGKWYWEAKLTTSPATTAHCVAVVGEDFQVSASDVYLTANNSASISYITFATNSGNAVTNFTGTSSSSSYGSAPSTNDIVGVALDLDNGKIFFSVNGTWQNSGDPETGTNPASSSVGSLKGDFVFPAFGDENFSTSASFLVNFGNPSFTISSGNSDGNGYGNFEYSVPSGYYALNSKNLAEYG